MNHQGYAAARQTTPVGNVKIALSENIVLLLHPHVDFRSVRLLRNLSWMANCVCK